MWRPPQFPTRAQVGWEAALLEIEHQAEHWNTPDHGETGYLIAQALRAAVEIARTGGLQCEHLSDGGRASAPPIRYGLIPSVHPSGLDEPVAIGDQRHVQLVLGGS